jgi:hypothetical protein
MACVMTGNRAPPLPIPERSWQGKPPAQLPPFPKRLFKTALSADRPLGKILWGWLVSRYSR